MRKLEDPTPLLRRPRDARPGLPGDVDDAKYVASRMQEPQNHARVSFGLKIDSKPFLSFFGRKKG